MHHGRPRGPRVCGPGVRRVAVGDASRFMRFEMVLRGSRDMVCMCDVVAGGTHRS